MQAGGGSQPPVGAGGRAGHGGGVRVRDRRRRLVERRRWGLGRRDDGHPPSGSAAPATGTATIEISDFAFGPQELTVQAGTVVTWANEDGVGHSIKSGDGSFDSPDFGQGETFSFTFNEPGTYPYVCGIHDSMTGTVVVEG